MSRFTFLAKQTGVLLPETPGPVHEGSCAGDNGNGRPFACQTAGHGNAHTRFFTKCWCTHRFWTRSFLLYFTNKGITDSAYAHSTVSLHTEDLVENCQTSFCIRAPRFDLLLPFWIFFKFVPFPPSSYRFTKILIAPIILKTYHQNFWKYSSSSNHRIGLLPTLPCLDFLELEHVLEWKYEHHHPLFICFAAWNITPLKTYWVWSVLLSKNPRHCPCFDNAQNNGNNGDALFGS